MTAPAEQTTTGEQHKPWRNVVLVTCADCDWKEIRRMYRSQRTVIWRWARRATIRHEVQTGHKSGMIEQAHI